MKYTQEAHQAFCKRLTETRHPLGTLLLIATKNPKEEEAWFVEGLALEETGISHPKKRTRHNADGYDPHMARYRTKARPSKLLDLLMKHAPQTYLSALAYMVEHVEGYTPKSVKDTEGFAYAWSLLENPPYQIQIEDDVQAVYSEARLSCMHKQPYTAWYNQLGVKVVTLRLRGKLKARALLWQAEDREGNSVTVMDSIYPCEGIETPQTRALLAWAKEHADDWRVPLYQRGYWQHGDMYLIRDVPKSEHGYPFSDSFGCLMESKEGRTLATRPYYAPEVKTWGLRTFFGEREQMTYP